MRPFLQGSAAVLVMLAAGWFAPTAWASDTIALDLEGESEHQKVIRLTESLEQSPDAGNSREVAGWLLSWAESTRDITIRVCDVLGPIPAQEDVPNGPLLLVQSVFGNAAFQLRHPERRGDTVAMQTAGIRSAVNAYRKLLASQPEARIPYFDELAARIDDGSFDRHVEPIIRKKCSVSDGS